MGLRKIQIANEVEGIKRLLDFLMEEVSPVRLLQKMVKALRLQNEEKDKGSLTWRTGSQTWSSIPGWMT